MSNRSGGDYEDAPDLGGRGPGKKGVLILGLGGAKGTLIFGFIPGAALAVVDVLISPPPRRGVECSRGRELAA